MTKKNSSNTQKMGTDKTRKYIVEAQAPTEGQTISSGGIRDKNGKLVSLYTNAVLCDDSYSANAYRESTYTQQTLLSPEAIKLLKALLFSIGNAVVNDYIIPVLNFKLHEAANKTISNEQTKKPHVSALNVQTPTEDVNSVIDKDARDKIIQFPTTRAS